MICICVFFFTEEDLHLNQSHSKVSCNHSNTCETSLCERTDNKEESGTSCNKKDKEKTKKMEKIKGG